MNSVPTSLCCVLHNDVLQRFYIYIQEHLLVQYFENKTANGILRPRWYKACAESMLISHSIPHDGIILNKNMKQRTNKWFCQISFILKHTIFTQNDDDK